MDPRLQDCLTAEQIGFAKRILDELELLLGIDLPDDGSPEGHAAGEIRAALKLVGREIGDKMRRIETDRDLSNAGRAKRFASLATDMRSRLANLERVITPKLQARLDALRAELAAPMRPLDENDAVGAIRQMEIRGRLSALDDASRIAAMWRAVEQGDAETLHAFSTAPMAFPLASEEALSEAMDSHWRQQRPDVAEAVEVVETLTEMLSSNFRSLRRVCDNLSGIIANDPAESVNAGADNSNE